MALDVTVILPNNLRSGYLQSEFLNSGTAYTTNKFSYSPNYDANKNQIVLGFEVRDKDTRELVAFKRIKSLYISNDPYFDSSATLVINDWPDTSTEHDIGIDYTYNINSSYFFDNSLSQGSIGSTTSGTGLFKINNWALSANGGLATVYIKAIIEGPGNQFVEYPNGYGIFDTIYWEGELPVNPSDLDFITLKEGWIGKNTKGYFHHSSSFSHGNNDGINGYLVSKYEVSSTGNTLDIYSSRATNTYRSLSPSASIANTGCNTFQFYRTSGTSNFSSLNFDFDTYYNLSSTTFNKGLFFYTKSKLLNSSTKPDYMAQASYGYTASSIGSTSSLFMKFYDSPDTSANSKEIVMRVDIPHNSNPTSYLYTVQNNIESSAKQITSLPNSLLPLFDRGGLLELYYSSLGTSYAYIESFFTPSIANTGDGNKSYLLANAIIPSFGTTFMGAGFGYQIETNGTEINSIKVNELVLASGINQLSCDIGDCSDSESTYINTPISKLSSTWTSDQNQEYLIIVDEPTDIYTGRTVNAAYVEIEKIDANNLSDSNSTFEIQLYKPSLSENFSFQVEFRHKSDDFYVCFSPKSSYRPHTVDSFTVNWDKPMGTRLFDDYALSNNPINAETITVLFSSDKNRITVMMRDSSGRFYKYNIKSYEASNSNVTYIIELSNQTPSTLKTNKELSASNSTWIYIKKLNGTKLDLIGYANLNFKIDPSSLGLGYYTSCGFIQSSFDNTGGSTYNRIFNITVKALPSKNNKSLESLKTFNLSTESLSSSKYYIGQKQIAGKTNFLKYGYNNPISSTSIINLSAASDGLNYSVSDLPSSTIDGIELVDLDLESFILLKDQINEDENGIYKKVTPSSYVLQSSSYDTPYRVTDGIVNQKTTFYKTRVIKNNLVKDRFISTSYFTKLKIKDISPFLSNIRPKLLEFRLKYLDYENTFDLDDLNVRFFKNTNDLPDINNPLTNWITTSYKPLVDQFTNSGNQSLIQVNMENLINQSPLVSSNDDLWLLITLPFNTSLAQAEGELFTDEYISQGSFTFYKLANNLWHKLFAYSSSKNLNENHKSNQHIRVRAKSHGFLESHATNISNPVFVDINGPSYNGSLPLLENVTDTTLRHAELTIIANDDDSGIMSFRVGREIDNFRTQYTPWMPWSQFTSENNGVYTIYLYGNLNYYTSGFGFTAFELQNMNFSGARKVWVQLMDYAGNISQTYPLTFVTQSWSLIDTQPPIGKVNFYNPNKNEPTNIISSKYPIAKLNANDIVSGVKDFKYRKIKDSGPDSWSDWEGFTSYKKFDFYNENDGVKKIEFVFRDFGNNSTQAEDTWEIVERPKK